MSVPWAWQLCTASRHNSCSHQEPGKLSDLSASIWVGCYLAISGSGSSFFSCFCSGLLEYLSDTAWESFLTLTSNLLGIMVADIVRCIQPINLSSSGRASFEYAIAMWGQVISCCQTRRYVESQQPSMIETGWEVWFKNQSASCSQ